MMYNLAEAGTSLDSVGPVAAVLLAQLGPDLLINMGILHVLRSYNLDILQYWRRQDWWNYSIKFSVCLLNTSLFLWMSVDRRPSE